MNNSLTSNKYSQLSEGDHNAIYLFLDIPSINKLSRTDSFHSKYLFCYIKKIFSFIDNYSLKKTPQTNIFDYFNSHVIVSILVKDINHEYLTLKKDYDRSITVYDYPLVNEIITNKTNMLKIIYSLNNNKTDKYILKLISQSYAHNVRKIVFGDESLGINLINECLVNTYSLYSDRDLFLAQERYFNEAMANGCVSIVKDYLNRGIFSAESFRQANVGIINTYSSNSLKLNLNLNIPIEYDNIEVLQAILDKANLNSVAMSGLIKMSLVLGKTKHLDLLLKHSKNKLYANVDWLLVTLCGFLYNSKSAQHYIETFDLDNPRKKILLKAAIENKDNIVFGKLAQVIDSSDSFNEMLKAAMKHCSTNMLQLLFKNKYFSNNKCINLLLSTKWNIEKLLDNILKYINPYELANAAIRRESILNGSKNKKSENNCHIDLLIAMINQKHIDPSYNNNKLLIHSYNNNNIPLFKILLECPTVNPNCRNNQLIKNCISSLKTRLYYVIALAQNKKTNISFNSNCLLIKALKTMIHYYPSLNNTNTTKADDFLNHCTHLIITLINDQRVDPSINKNKLLRLAYNKYIILNKQTSRQKNISAAFERIIFSLIKHQRVFVSGTINSCNNNKSLKSLMYRLSVFASPKETSFDNYTLENLRTDWEKIVKQHQTHNFDTNISEILRKLSSYTPKEYNEEFIDVDGEEEETSILIDGQPDISNYDIEKTKNILDRSKYCSK